jgi:hypothetical protein
MVDTAQIVNENYATRLGEFIARLVSQCDLVKISRNDSIFKEEMFTVQVLKKIGAAHRVTTATFTREMMVNNMDATVMADALIEKLKRGT